MSIGKWFKEISEGPALIFGVHVKKEGKAFPQQVMDTLTGDGILVFHYFFDIRRNRTAEGKIFSESQATYFESSWARLKNLKSLILISDEFSRSMLWSVW